MSIPDGYRVATIGPRPIKVPTMVGVQNHRGYTAVVYPPDKAPLIKCGDVHKTRKGAEACAALIARRVARGEPWAWGPRLEWKRDRLTPD